MKMMVRSFSLLLIVSIMLSMTVGATAVFTQAESRVLSVSDKDITQMPSGLTPWDGTKSKPAVGDGSEGNPYQISNGAELAWFGDRVQYSSERSKCAILVNDIDLNNKDWSGFRIGGISGYNYAGKFDGQGHTIYNLSVSKNNNRAGGLFGIIGLSGGGATIKNLNLVNANAKWVSTAATSSDTPTLGIVCGEVRFADSVVENVHVFSGEITAADNGGVAAAGGVVGKITGGTVKNCTANVNIKLDNITNVNETYSSETNNKYGVGGVVGVVATSSTVETNITNCGFSGSINAPKSSRVGGVIGNLAKTSDYSVVDCYNTGSVTGYRQVGGVIGWVYDGTGATIAPKRIYNTGAVTAKTDTSSYAAGLLNGMNFSLLSYPAYSTGDVSAPSGFNNTCALLYTSLSDASQKDLVYALYAEQGSKHPLSAAGAAVADAKDVYAMSQAEFADGTAQITLSAGGDKTPWYAKAELNESKPVFEHQVVHTYDLTDSTVKLELDEPGIIPVTVAPIGTGVIVSLDSDAKTINERGTYLFKASTTTPKIQVSGRAKVTVNLGLKKEAKVLTNLEATKIRVSYPETNTKTVVLAFYQDSVLQDVVYQQDVQPEVVDGTGYVSAIIDLTGKNVKGCTLKAFLWENNTLKPIDAAEYIGKYDGPSASISEKEAALVAVAESYLQRGSRIQYDSEPIAEDGSMRYTLGAKSPEDYSGQLVGFTDENAFLYDVYDKALGIEIVDEFIPGSALEVVSTAPALLEESELNIGDILYVDYASQKDQKMLYLGDGKLVYATGESYDAVTGKDNKEEDGAIKEATLDGIMGCQTVSVLRPFVLYEAKPLSQEVKNRIQNMQGVMAEKLSSHTAGVTVHPGEEVTYTYRIENTNKEEVNLDITDELSEYTTLVSGCDAADGNELSWNVSVPAGETELVSYTVKVSDDTSVCGNVIDASKGMVGGLSVTCSDNSIELTMNEVDEERLQMGMHALSDSEFEYTTLVKWIYNVAFSKSASITGTPAEVLEQIYAGATAGGGGNNGATGEELPETVAKLLDMVPPSMFGGRGTTSKVEVMFGQPRATILSQDDFITGDILIVQKDIADATSATMYIYNGSKFLELVSNKMNKNDASVLLEKMLSYDRFVVLRPSMVLTSLNHYKTGEREVLTPAQEAIITTAESYLLRGDRMQYDDTRFTSSGEYRWQVREKHPEEYTRDEWGYSNCAAFTFDTYYHGLDFDIGFNKNMWNTGGLMDSKPAAMHVYSYTKSPSVGPADLTDAEKEAMKKEVLETLQPGDIIVVRREASGSGHAMLYVGNETIIHSSGSNYNYSNSTETYEPTVRYRSALDLFTYGDSSCIFGHETPSKSVKYFGIVRPLNVKDTIPQYTKNRVANMKRIRAEKVSSHTSCMNINPGETITYTFAVYNANDEEVTLDVTDTIPTNTTYLSGDASVDGNNLSWKITVPAGEKVTVSYQVKVNADVTNGTYIGSESGTVGGVPVNCPKVLVARTLTAAEQAKLIATAKEMKGTELTDIALANALYKEVTGVENLLPGSAYADIIDGIFMTATEQSGYLKLNPEGTYAEMVIPSMYGGRKFYTPQWEYKRVRLPRMNQLIPGDILVSRTSSAERLHLFNGEKFLDLCGGLAEDTNHPNKRLEWLLAYGRDFAILRPSLAIK